MRYQPGVFVKLNPDSFTGTDNKAAPIWGGPYGFIGGMVKKTYTNDHESKNHTALVEWTNLEKGSFREEELLPLSVEESEYSLEYGSAKGVMPRDIFVLIKMSSGRYVLNVIESNASYTTPRPAVPVYCPMLTKHALAAIDKPDVLLISEALSFPDVKEERYGHMFAAETAVLRHWDIVAPRAIYHPLPTYKTLQEAAAAAPASGEAPGAYAFFHLPENLCDFGVSDSS